MSEKKEPHEKLADGELDLKAAQQVHLADDFKKADQAGKEQDSQGDSKNEDKEK
ncbi:YfhE family protein [Planococcus sp. YIM B11945]|uniref:YfhE family protein n=1 Tax=Planococcus sp. YIM B11945 TaxID=3435410 RepID=UPI003D7D128C